MGHKGGSCGCDELSKFPLHDWDIVSRDGAKGDKEGRGLAHQLKHKMVSIP